MTTITSSSVFLICATCKHKFSYEFTAGCMRAGEIKTLCPQCGQLIRLVEGEVLEDGSAVFDLVGATRGLHLVFTRGEDVTDDAL